jgi:hypothetical protein
MRRLPTAASSSLSLRELLAADRTAGVGDALARLDARWIAPAADMLARGAWHSLTVIANDRCLTSGGTMAEALAARRRGLAALA